ncbi:MAG TPA: hypothetical protein VKS25_07765 [Solirubrobacteraceae bacterium]|nr:hypothetical protein [Solirubrobacteraceae bacterium]
MIATFRGYRRAAGLDPFDESAPFAARIAEIETEIDRRLGVAG